MGLHGHLGRVAVLEDTTPDEVAAADIVLVGCWSEADEPFGGEATSHLVEWIEGLPSLAGKPIGAFTAHSALPHPFSDPVGHAEESLSALTSHLVQRGAVVAAAHSFSRLGLDREAGDFVEAVLAVTR